MHTAQSLQGFLFVGFSRPRKAAPLSWLIRKVMGTDFSHVFLQFTRNGQVLIFEASLFGVRYTQASEFKKSNITTHGFRLRSSRPLQDLINRTCDVIVGRKYGYKQLIGILLARMFSLKKNIVSKGLGRQVCSETVGFILESHFNIKFNKSLDLVDPLDIHNVLMRKLSK